LIFEIEPYKNKDKNKTVEKILSAGDFVLDQKFKIKTKKYYQ
jgi:hypothetical protein